MNNPSSPILFIDDSSFISANQFKTQLKQYTSLFVPHSHILMKISHPILFNTALILSQQQNVHLYICPPHLKTEQIEFILERFPIQFYLTDEGESFHSRSLTPKNPPSSTHHSGALYVFTSGTTGSPKITQQEWARIQHSAVMSKKLTGKIWLMTYALHSYAGLQVFFSAYHNQGIVYYPKQGDKELAAHLLHYGIQVISATPTYWKILISRWPSHLPPLQLEQATVGGEIVRQDVLDLIQQFFHPKQLTHIYASSEAGTAIVVSDKLEGFPIEYLSKKKDVQLRIQDNKLQVKSPYAMTHYLNAQSPLTADGWIDTGDLIKIENERVYFLGRQDEIINVGGLKVYPEEVELALGQLEEVADSCVYAKKNPIMGNIVAAHVVLKSGYQLDISSMNDRLRSLLTEFKIPRFIQQVSYIEVSSNGKKIRPK